MAHTLLVAAAGVLLFVAGYTVAGARSLADWVQRRLLRAGAGGQRPRLRSRARTTRDRRSRPAATTTRAAALARIPAGDPLAPEADALVARSSGSGRSSRRCSRRRRRREEQDRHEVSEVPVHRLRRPHARAAMRLRPVAGGHDRAAPGDAEHRRRPSHPADVIYRPEPSARAQARAAIQKRAAVAHPQPESFDLPLFATPASTIGRRCRIAAAAVGPPRRPTRRERARRHRRGVRRGPSSREPVADADADTEPRLEAALEFDALSLRHSRIRPDPDLSLPFGGHPLGGGPSAPVGGALHPGPAAEAIRFGVGGFARVRRRGAPSTEPRRASDVPRATGARRRPRADSERRRPHSTCCRSRICRPAPMARRRSGPRMLAGLVDIASWRRWIAPSSWRRCAPPASSGRSASRCRSPPLAVFLVLLRDRLSGDVHRARRPAPSARRRSALPSSRAAAARCGSRRRSCAR
jgi:hypothetical protein